ncbi:hypothetical protein LBMAG42_20880 [Deltaproteobacteria bacterium]|nr:hypothetical protein LBMAG42_20880 [Deltaproteobacteria bacterium]
MAAIRIRTGGVEVDVDDEASLDDMRRRGLLGADAERLTSQGWQVIHRLARPSPSAAADPWAAWSDVDEHAAEAALETITARPGDDLVELPIGAVTPMPNPIVTSRPKNLAGTAVPAPPPAASPVVSPARVPPAVPVAAPPSSLPPLAGGQLIDFPSRPRTTTPTLTRPPAPPPPLVRPWRVLGMILVGVSIAGGLWAVAEMTRPVSQPVLSVAPPVTPKAVDPFKALEAELRAAPLGDVREVHRPGDLGDALLIELQQLGLEIVSVNATVTRWSGRKSDLPAAAEVRVTFRPSESLNRDLGAILIAAGRYKLHYKLDIPVLEATMSTDEGLQATVLDPSLAEKFAQSRIGLKAALGLK